jgi:hypothetical protein
VSNVHWKKRHRPSGIEFRCQESGREVYLSFNWNGTEVWEYACSHGARNATSFAKFLRHVADQLEQTP